MLRFARSVAVLTLVVTPITVWGVPRHDALACTGGIMLDYAAAQADIIALVEAIAVGGPENLAPTLTPSATATRTPMPLRTPTVPGSRTATVSPNAGSATPTTIETPSVPKFVPDVNLTGI